MRDLTKHIIMLVVSVHIIQKPNRIDALLPHCTPTKAKLNAWAKCIMQIKLPTVAVGNGPALLCITLMYIQCGWMQHALLRIIMRIVGLGWTDLYFVILK